MAPAPKLVTAARDGGDVVVVADGDAVLRLSDRQALWLIVRVGEALAVRS